MKEQITVKELRDKLNKVIENGHGKAKVIIEGCDCDGPCIDVYVTTDPHEYAILERG